MPLTEWMQPDDDDMQYKIYSTYRMETEGWVSFLPQWNKIYSLL